MRLPTIGELRHRLRLEAAVRSPDGGGGADTAWEPVGDVWASVKAVGGTEQVSAEALAGRVTHEIWIRHRGDAAPAMRFVAGARAYDIRAVLDPDGGRRWLRCLVEERLS
jgi:SPP1 family predicted phage head-tail adaptor